MPRGPSPELLELLAPHNESLVRLALEARAAILRRAPTAWELLYETYAVSTAFSLSEDLKHAFCHVAVYKKHVNLGFNRGVELPDPESLLQGTGKLIRHVRLGPRVDVDAGPVAELIEAAIEQMQLRRPEGGDLPSAGGVVVKSRRGR